MSVNNLRNYNWEQGTQASPVLLTGAEFNKLTALIEESNRVGSNINADIRGWVQVGQNISSYQKYLAELAKDGQGNPLLHVVNTQIDPVSYTVTPQSNSLKEGDSTKLNINGISLSALKFRITNHTVQSLDYQERTTIDTELGYVRVAPAQENTTWSDVVTIQCCPVWEEWTDPNASIVEFDITVNAVAVTSVTITAPQYVKPGITFNPIVNFLPVGHTKPIVNTLEDAGAKRGICFIPTSDDFSVGKTTDPTKMSAIAPSTETPVGDTWSLGCGVYAFTSAQTMATPSVNVAVKYPYIQFNVTTDGTLSDITNIKPSITLQKIDSEEHNIGNPIVLDYDTYAVVSGSTIVYTYGGGFVAGDGSETYKVTFDEAPSGYRNIQQMTITPNQVITEITVQYVVKRPDIYQVYSNSYEPIQDVLDRGAFKSDTRVGIAIVTKEVSFIFKVTNDEVHNGSLVNDNIRRYQTPRMVSTLQPDIKEDFNGERNTLAYKNDLINIPTEDENPGINIATSHTITYNGHTYNSYIISYGELDVFVQNKAVIYDYIHRMYSSDFNLWNTDGCTTSSGSTPTEFWHRYITTDNFGRSVSQDFNYGHYVTVYKFEWDD